jgi:hypothetical protein
LIAGSGKAGNLHTIKTNPRNIKIRKSEYRGNVPYVDYINTINNEVLEITPNEEGDFWKATTGNKSGSGKFILTGTGELKVVSGMKKTANVVVKTFSTNDIYGDLISRLSDEATCVNTLQRSSWDSIANDVIVPKKYIKNIANSINANSDIYTFQEDPDIGQLYDKALPKDANNKYRQRCPDIKPVSLNDILSPECRGNVDTPGCTFITEPVGQDLYCESWIGRPEEVIKRERPSKVYKPSIRTYGHGLYGLLLYGFSRDNPIELDNLITDNGRLKTLEETNKNIEKIYKDTLIRFETVIKGIRDRRYDSINDVYINKFNNPKILQEEQDRSRNINGFYSALNRDISIKINSIIAEYVLLEVQRLINTTLIYDKEPWKIKKGVRDYDTMRYIDALRNTFSKDYELLVRFMDYVAAVINSGSRFNTPLYRKYGYNIQAGKVVVNFPSYTYTQQVCEGMNCNRLVSQVITVPARTETFDGWIETGENKIFDKAGSYTENQFLSNMNYDGRILIPAILNTYKTYQAIYGTSDDSSFGMYAFSELYNNRII